MSQSDADQRKAAEPVGPPAWPAHAALEPDAPGFPFPVDLGGRRALVTGGADGIGYAIAFRLAQAGAEVLIVDNDTFGLEIAEKNFVANGLCLRAIKGDLSKDGTALADRLLDDHGVIHLIVNNVGICTGTSFSETDAEKFDRVFATNLRGPWFLTRRLIQELLVREEAGSVLFISSLHDWFVSYRPQYSASKAGVRMLVRELAALYARQGIRVNAIAPGYIPQSDNTRRDAERVVPAGRGGTPDDVAKLAVFLLSDLCAGYLTGVEIPVDGGLALHTWYPGPEPKGRPGSA